MLAGWLIIFGLAGFLLGLFCMIRPWRRIGVSTRRRAGALLAASVTLFGIGVALTPTSATSTPPAQAEAGTLPPKPASAAADPFAKHHAAIRFYVAAPEYEQRMRLVARWRDNPPAAAPQLLDCGDEVDAEDPLGMCVSNQLFLVSRDWRGALRGELDPARNIASCLSDGCEGAVQREPIRGCAWRLAIAASGSPGLISTDADRLGMACRDLSDGDQALARTEALKLSADVPAFHDAD